MSTSPSGSPAPADSPVALALSPKPPPLVDSPVSPPPTEAAAPFVLPSQSPPPTPANLENPPQSPPPPPATFEIPPRSASPPSMVIPDQPPPPSPSLPSETPPPSPSLPSGVSPPAISPPPPSPSLPAGTPPPDPSLPPPSPPRRRRQTPPSLPPPSNPTSPPSQKPSFVPETSTPPSEPSTTPFSPTSPPQKPPSDSNLPFFRPSDPNPNPNNSISPISPQIPVTLPNTSSGGFPASSSPPQLLPLVPKSLPETSLPPHPSTGLAFGGIIVGVLFFVLLGLLFVCYRATRSRNHKPASRNSEKTTTSKASKELKLTSEDAVQDATHIISFPQQHHQTTGNSNSTSVRNHQTQTSSPATKINISSGTCSYNELADATAGFSESNLLGQGGFGYVHRGVLPNGKEIAVKQLKIGSDQGEREFQAEVDTISRVHHKHLVSLVGYCINGDKRLLVYEFVPNNTLEFHLHGQERHVLEWEMRRRIAIGAAKGLAYLHEDCNPTIIHRDIKASNILLDSNFEAKVSDFGLARLFSDPNSSITHVSTRVVGTFGYMAPEYALSGKLTEKSDVYSFGVVLLELIMGQPPILTKTSLVNENIVDKARPLIGKALEEGTFDGFVDEKLQRNYDSNQMANMVACAAACVRQSAWLRPRMSEIVRGLEGEVSLSGVMEGITAGRSTSYRSSDTSNNDSGRYRFDMKRFKESLGGSTSEFGLNSSCSSCQTKLNM